MKLFFRTLVVLVILLAGIPLGLIALGKIRPTAFIMSAEGALTEMSALDAPTIKQLLIVESGKLQYQWRVLGLEAYLDAGLNFVATLAVVMAPSLVGFAVIYMLFWRRQKAN